MNIFSINTYLVSLFSKNPDNLVLLDLTGVEAITDFIVICSGKTKRQVSAIAEYVRQDLKKQGIISIGFEGIREGEWVVLDYGEVVIHIFQEVFRDFYDLEGLWFNVKKTKINKLSDFL